MPPEGYETVTLPEDLVEELESMSLGNSHRGVIRGLIMHYRGTEDTSEIDPDELNALLEDSTLNTGAQYDDVVQACRKALRQELPERVLSR